MKTTAYPIDYDALNKGDVFEPQQIEDIVGVKRDHKNYALRLLNFKGETERELRVRGKTWTLASDHDSLRILTDREALEYNARAFARHRRGLARDHARMMGIDPDSLSSTEQETLGATIHSQGKQLQALRQARRALPKPEPPPMLRRP